MSLIFSNSNTNFGAVVDNSASTRVLNYVKEHKAVTIRTRACCGIQKHLLHIYKMNLRGLHLNVRTESLKQLDDNIRGKKPQMFLWMIVKHVMLRAKNPNETTSS